MQSVLVLSGKANGVLKVKGSVIDLGKPWQSPGNVSGKPESLHIPRIPAASAGPIFETGTKIGKGHVPNPGQLQQDLGKLGRVALPFVFLILLVFWVHRLKLPAY
jgi:hypothetical protein